MAVFLQCHVYLIISPSLPTTHTVSLQIFPCKNGKTNSGVMVPGSMLHSFQNTDGVLEG